MRAPARRRCGRRAVFRQARVPAMFASTIRAGGTDLAPWVASMCDRDVGRAPRYGSTAGPPLSDAMTDVAIAPVRSASPREALARPIRFSCSGFAVDRGPEAAFKSALHIGRCEGGARQHQRDGRKIRPRNAFVKPAGQQPAGHPLLGSIRAAETHQGNTDDRSH
jgi:hypothetical protein